jgi:hypothetical protein
MDPLLPPPKVTLLARTNQCAKSLATQSHPLRGLLGLPIIEMIYK